MHRIIQLSLGLAFMAGAAGASAATVGLTPSSAVVQAGGQVSLDIVADFGNASVLGGVTDIKWDSSVLSFSSFSFNADIAAQAMEMALPISDSQLTIGFGKLGGMTLGAGTIIGSMTFDAVGSAGSSTAISLSDNRLVGYIQALAPLSSDDLFFVAGMSGDKGDWSDKGDWKHDDFPGFTPIDVDYSGADVSIAAVPVPAAGWLLLTALGGLFGLRRRQEKREVENGSSFTLANA